VQHIILEARKLSQSPEQNAADSPAPRSRNRAATRDAILAAAKAQLADHGFAAFGVNAVARRALCDKQLVYRYFGGLDGLIDAIGDDLATWVSDRLSAGGDLPASDTYGQRLDQILQRYLAALRADPLMQRIIAWEASENAPHVRRLADARSRALMLWVARMRGGRTPREDLDVPALNAVLIAAIQHLVLCGAATGQFISVPLATDADWMRIQAMVSRLIRAMHD
jgi:AcrR family transcriptional regulator